jgi:type II secretory pathway pseudopilin PulG
MRVKNSTLRQRGYTVIELIAALGACSIIAAVSAPKVLLLNEYTRISTESIAVQTILRNLGPLSQLHGKTYELTWQRNELQIQNLDQPNQPRVIHTLPPQMRLLPNSGTSIRSFPSGSYSPRTVRIRSPHYTCLLVISLRGRIKRSCDRS